MLQALGSIHSNAQREKWEQIGQYSMWRGEFKKTIALICFVCACIGLCACTLGPACGVREQLVWVSSFLLPCRTQDPIQTVRPTGKHLYPWNCISSPRRRRTFKDTVSLNMPQCITMEVKIVGSHGRHRRNRAQR